MAKTNDQLQVPPISGEKMDIPSGEGLGTIQCDRSVFKEIAGNTAMKVEGVAGIGGRSTLGDILLFKEKDSGIDVQTVGESNEVTITINVTIFFNYNIYEVCTELQRQIKDTVEAITSYSVKAVHVRVQSLKTQEEDVNLVNSRPDSGIVEE